MDSLVEIIFIFCGSLGGNQTVCFEQMTNCVITKELVPSPKKIALCKEKIVHDQKTSDSSR